MSPVLIVYLGIVGLCFGSFLNVVAYRVPLGRSVIGGRSACPVCSATIVWYDDIPVLSWLLLRGRCRHCANPISVRYPLGELLTGVLFALAAWLAPNGWVLALILVVIIVAVAVGGVQLTRALDRGHA